MRGWIAKLLDAPHSGQLRPGRSRAPRPHPLIGNSSSRSAPATPTASTRYWRTPALSSARSPPASSAPLGARCLTPSSPAPRTRPSSPTWPAASCARSCPPCDRPCSATSAPTMLSSSASSSPTSTTWTRPSSTQIDTLMAPFAEQLARLDTIRGVNKRTAEVLIAELGPDMSVFPTAKHAASWAGLCPGSHESAGKHRSGRTRHGNRWLRAALIEAALAASVRSTTGAFAARYRRVRHRGHKKAIVAVAHTPSSWPRTISWRVRPPIRTLAPTTTTADMPSGSATGPFKPWNAKAIASPSNLQPEREDWPAGDFLSKAPSRSGPMGAGGQRSPCVTASRDPNPAPSARRVSRTCVLCGQGYAIIEARRQCGRAARLASRRNSRGTLGVGPSPPRGRARRARIRPLGHSATTELA